MALGLSGILREGRFQVPQILGIYMGFPLSFIFQYIGFYYYPNIV